MMKSSMVLVGVLLGVSLWAGEILVNVSGMKCQSCVKKVKGEFSADVNDKNENIKVDLERQEIKLDLKAHLTDEKLKSRIEEMGYEVKKITR